MFKTDVLFTGFYGQLNAGDDAFVEVASWGAKEYWKKSNNRFIGLNRNLPKTIVPVKGYPFSVPRTYNLQKKILLKNTKCLISAGGSTIHNNFPDHDPKSIALNLKKMGGGIKIGAIGVSIGPFQSSSDEKFIQEYLKQIDFLSLRDRRSYNYVKSLSGLPYTPVPSFDLAALLPDLYKFSKVRSSKRVIGISVCPYESLKSNGDLKNENRRNNALVELIKYIDGKSDVEFKFFIINGHPSIGDKRITNSIIEKAKPKNYSIEDYSRDTRNIWMKINSCHAFISTRLHGAIFACFGTTPFLLVEYHQKCTDFLLDVGYKEDMRLYDADFNVKEKGDMVLTWCDDPTSFEIPQFIKENEEKALLNFKNIVF